MLIKIHKNRSVSSVGTWGTKNENNYEILDFEFPEELQDYNKRIVYYLDNTRVWDAILDNKAILTNAITTKGSVKAYVWCTKTDAQYKTDVDFRTQLFEMNFYENKNADGIVPTPEQVDGFNTMLTAMNDKIEEMDALETSVEQAEETRQANETTRQTNEQTRQNNEQTRQRNEQTRQEQEASREERTNTAISHIVDLTEEYNANAEAKTTAFNNNATQKTNEFNSNYTQKVNDFNSNATSKTNDFDNNASSKTTAFNDNAASKTNTFNSNASSKTTDFNTNAENKTLAFNTNASEKTTAFDNNASSKTTDFNTNAESKTSAFNDNATQKTTDFNNNAISKTEEFDEHTAEMQQEIDELSANMPWGETEQATEIQVTDAAKYSRNKLELFGNTSQDTSKIIYKCDGTETGDYYLTYDSSDYYFTMPTITEGDILVFNTTDLKLYLGDTEITTESTGAGTNLTFISSPNPDYTQDIHVVSGVPYIFQTGKNLVSFLPGYRSWRNTNIYVNNNLIRFIKPGTDGLADGAQTKMVPFFAKAGESIYIQFIYNRGEITASQNNSSAIVKVRFFYIDGTTTDASIYINRNNYKTLTETKAKITATKDIHMCRLLSYLPSQSFNTDGLYYNIMITKNSYSDYLLFKKSIIPINLTKNIFDKNNMTIINGYIDNTKITIRNNYSDKTMAIECKPNTTYIVKKVYETSRFGVATYNEENLPIETGTAASYDISNAQVNNNSRYFEITTDENSKWLLIYYSQTNDDNTQSLQEAAIDTLQVYEKNSGIEMLKIGDYEDKFEFKEGQWVIPNKIKKIDSYNGEEITTDYISTTGGLDIGATVYYVGNEDYIIENDELINELNIISKLQTNKNENYINIINRNSPVDISEDVILKPYMKLTYMQDLPSKLDNLDSRLSLLE